MHLFSFGKPKNKYSLENLKYLYGTLVKNPIITPQNSSVVVETLRQIAEVLIWGDQNNNSLFEFFLEKNLLGFFVSILEQKTSIDVIIQLLQTLSILALSLKLDKSTINFFFNGLEKDFPLYTEAIKFVNNKETMIRIAVRTLTLNIFKVWFIRQQCATLNKILEKSSHDNIGQLNYYVEELTDQFYYLHDIFNLGFDSMNLVLAEQFIQYLIFPLFIGSLLDHSKNPDLEDRLTPALALFLLAQVFHIFTFKPLLDTVALAIVSTTPSQSLLLATTLSAPPPLSLLGSQRKHYNSFRRFSSFPNLEQLVGDNNNTPPPSSPRNNKSRFSLRSSTSNGANANTTTTLEPPKPAEQPPEAPTSDVDEELESNVSHSPQKNGDMARLVKSDLSSSIDSGSTNMSGDSEGIKKAKHMKRHNRNEYKEKLLDLIHNDRDTFGVVCMLYSFLKNVDVDSKILEAGGVLPYRHAKAKKLLEGLLSPENRSPVMSSSLPGNMGHHSRSKSESHAHLELFSSSSKLPAFSSPSRLLEPKFGTSSYEHNQSGSQLSSSPVLKIFKPVQEEDEHGEFVPVPDSSQAEFTRNLIDHLFFVLVNSNKFRLVTLQMTLLILKELVYSPESPSKLTEKQLSLLEEAYTRVTNNLRECLVGNLSAIFLELFEEELRLYKQIDFEALIKDVALILPIPHTPISRLALSRRLPSGEAEKTQKAIQQFLVLRELKFTLLRKKDTMLPLKQPHIPIVREKDLFNLDTDNFDIIYYYQVAPAVAGSNSSSGKDGSTPKKRVRACGVLFHSLLLNVDPNNVPPQTKPGIYGTITHIAPLQRLEIETSHLDPSVVRVFSHPTTWNVDMGFDDETKCAAAKAMLERARDDVRSSKMRQIYSLLGEKDPDDDDNLGDSNGALSNGNATPPSRSVIVPVECSNSHPLAFSDDGMKPPAKNKATSKSTGFPSFDRLLGDGGGGSPANKRHSSERKETVFSSVEPTV
eukprot:gene6690-7780_t